MDDYGLQASPIIQASIRITAVCYSHLITKLIIDEYHKLKPSTVNIKYSAIANSKA